MKICNISGLTDGTSYRASRQRKNQNLPIFSMSEIKTAMESKSFVFDCDYTNNSGVRKVRRCFDELVKAGAAVEIYEDGDLTTRDFISNLLNSYQEIDREIQDQIDAEVAAEGGNEEYFFCLASQKQQPTTATFPKTSLRVLMARRDFYLYGIVTSQA